MTGGVPQRMANMALVCVCIVALSHVGYDTDVGSAGWWFVRMTRCGICCLAVPFFFVVSGYFLSRHFGEPGWWRKETAKRLMSLAVPYLVWGAIFFVFARLGVSAMRLLAGKGFALSFPLAKLWLALGVNMSATPMLVAGTWLVVPAKPWPKWLTSLSFPIYVMHFFVIFALDGFRAPRVNKSIGFMLAEFAAAVAVPSVIALLLRRIFPRAAAFAFGGR